MSFLACVTVAAGSFLVSTRIALTGCPLMPPLLLVYSSQASMSFGTPPVVPEAVGPLHAHITPTRNGSPLRAGPFGAEAAAPFDSPDPDDSLSPPQPAANTPSTSMSSAASVTLRTDIPSLFLK